VQRDHVIPKFPLAFPCFNQRFLAGWPQAVFGRSEYDFINRFLFDDFPSRFHFLPVKFPDHGCITRICRFRFNVIAYEIEITGQLGIADPFGVGSIAIGEAIQKRKNFIRSNLANCPFTEFTAKRLNDGLIGS
jgi:hypothetical protein